MSFYDHPITQAMGEWITTMTDWDMYATMTFRDPNNPRFPNWTKVGWKAANNALNRFNYELVMETGRNPLWVACGELQSRGTPHWHLLIGNVEDVRRMNYVDWWYENYGIARILPYDRNLGAQFYLGKYVSKAITDLRFSPGLAGQLARLKV